MGEDGRGAYVSWMEEVSDIGIGEVVLSTFDVLQRFGLLPPNGFSHSVWQPVDGLVLVFLGDIIGGDDCDDDE
ncbi:hypothetical protein Tco_0060025 [Tanacetum coccineum]